MLNSKDIFITEPRADAPSAVNASQKDTHTHTYSHKSYIHRWTCRLKKKWHSNNSVCTYYPLIYGDFVLRKKKQKNRLTQSSLLPPRHLYLKVTLGGDMRQDSNSKVLAKFSSFSFFNFDSKPPWKDWFQGSEPSCCSSNERVIN